MLKNSGFDFIFYNWNYITIIIIFVLSEILNGDNLIKFCFLDMNYEAILIDCF